MMEIVISLRPEWAAAILDGHKTLEVRTSGPENWTLRKEGPATVWIYETKNGGGCGLVVGKFLCRKIHIKNANRLNREERAELEQRTGLSLEQMQEYQGRRTGLRFWEVEQPEAVKPFPLKELGLGCPPMSWCRARRRKK